MGHLEKVAGVIDRLLKWWIVGGLTIMVTGILCDVILRETISYSITWNLELAQYCLINLTYVGAALAFRRRAHISINTVAVLLPVWLEKWMDLAARCLVLPFLLTLAYSGVQILQKARGVTPSLRLPMAVYYLPILVGGTLLCFYAVVQILEAFHRAKGAGEPAVEAGAPRGAV